MPPVGFEHTISAGELPQTYGLDRAANGTVPAPSLLTNEISMQLLPTYITRCVLKKYLNSSAPYRVLRTSQWCWGRYLDLRGTR